MNFNRFNNYRELDSSTKQFIRTNGYSNIITNMISTMFDFSEFTITEKYFLFDILLNHGLAYVEKKEKGFLIIPATYKNLPEKGDIFPSEIIATGVYQGGTIQINDNIKNLKGDVFYCFPNRLPIDEIPRFAYQFAEIDTSLVNNIQFSRIAPLVSSPHENIRKSYAKAIENMMRGDLINSISATQNVLNNETKSVEKINISDGDYSEKIQYLSMYHTQMISRLANLFGIQYNFISKQANITNDELNSNESFCAIYPLMMKSLLQECVDNFNKKMGTNISFKFSRAWAHLNKIDNDPVSEQPDTEQTNVKEIFKNENISNT